MKDTARKCNLFTLILFLLFPFEKAFLWKKQNSGVHISQQGHNELLQSYQQRYKELKYLPKIVDFEISFFIFHSVFLPVCSFPIWDLTCIFKLKPEKERKKLHSTFPGGTQVSWFFWQSTVLGLLSFQLFPLAFFHSFEQTTSQKFPNQNTRQTSLNPKNSGVLFLEMHA